MNAVKNKPATPLPWTSNPDSQNIYSANDRKGAIAMAINTHDAAYMLHAANAYPKLVAALLALTETGHTPEDRDEYLRKAHTAADDLLSELGEV